MSNVESDAMQGLIRADAVDCRSSCASDSRRGQWFKAEEGCAS